MAELSPEKKREAVALREAGLTIGVIAKRVGASPRTVDRVCREFGAIKGATMRASIEKARAELADDAVFISSLKTGLRALALDSVAQSLALRDKLAATLENIESSDLESAALASRALAACATAIRVSADAVRGLEATTKEGEVVPELVVGVMDSKEIEAIKAQNMAGNDGAGEMNEADLAEMFDHGE